jgi:predicted TIM-barrel fold metal-dependent hydrolase
MTEIIDIHPHIVSQDTEKYPVTPLGGKRSDWSHERSVTLEELLSAMDAAGVAKAALVHSSTTYGFNNSYVADAVALHPERLTGVFSVDVLSDDAPGEIDRWRAKGLTGLRIFSKGSTIAKQWLSLDDPRLYPAMEKADALGLSVCINVHATREELVQVHALLKRFPTLRVVLDHLGRVKVKDGPPYDGAAPLFELAPYDNFYLKLTPRLVEDLGAEGSKATAETFLPRLVTEFGGSRIAFGSNYPASGGSLPQLVGQVLDILQPLSADDRALILSGTARKLYPALAEAPAAKAALRRGRA